METEEKYPLSVEEIALLRAVARWRRANGVRYFQWRPGVGFGALTEWKLIEKDPEYYRGHRHVNVTYEPASYSGPNRIVATRDHHGDEGFKELPVRTVTEAIDVLAALGYLPVRFSSAFAAGWHAERNAALLGGPVADLPDTGGPLGRCY